MTYFGKICSHLIFILDLVYRLQRHWENSLALTVHVSWLNTAFLYIIIALTFNTFKELLYLITG